MFAAENWLLYRERLGIKGGFVSLLLEKTIFSLADDLFFKTSHVPTPLRSFILNLDPLLAACRYAGGVVESREISENLWISSDLVEKLQREPKPQGDEREIKSLRVGKHVGITCT